jgi:hypothetical protein
MGSRFRAADPIRSRPASYGLVRIDPFPLIVGFVAKLTMVGVGNTEFERRNDSYGKD